MRRAMPEHDSLPVMVPRNEKRLAPVLPDRVRRLEMHLRECLDDLAKVKRSSRPGRAPPPQPEGFAAVVASAACSLCKGHCCRNGDDTGFLDVGTIARIRREHPAMTEQAVVQSYLGRVPVDSYRGSCIFHGRKGCTLDRSMRSDVCNTYLCRGLGDYVRRRAAPEPTIVIAGDSGKTWVSPVLMPNTPTKRRRAARPAEAAGA